MPIFEIDGEAVLSFWFDDHSMKEWFAKDDTFDSAIRERFEPLLSNLGNAPDQAFQWADTPRGALAAILVLDQFPRNLYRETPEAFQYDPLARELARKAIALGHHCAPMFGLHHKVFMILPFEHSEDLADQLMCRALMAALGDPNFIDYGEQHRVIIERFGRFPHRNKALGRISTDEEVAFLKEPNSSF